VYDRPANQFVAGFIGSPTMSFLPCTIVSDDGMLFARGASFSVRIPDERRPALAAANPHNATLGVRPEDILLHADAAGSIAAVVDIVEPLGSEQVLYFTCDGERLTARAAADASVATGDAIALGINPKRMHLFDSATGAAYF
jgi:multiple sugar transport system ATP-binding protein